MTTCPDRRRLVEAPGYFLEHYGVELGYSRFYAAAMLNKIPVERISGRLYWRESHAGEIAKGVGIVAPAVSRASRRRPRAA